MFPVYTFVWCPIIFLSSYCPFYFFLPGTNSHLTLFIHSLVCSLSHFPLLLECKLYTIYCWVGQKVHLAFPQEAERNFRPTQYILSAKFSTSFSWINQLNLLTPMFCIVYCYFFRETENVLIKGQYSVVENSVSWDLGSSPSSTTNLKPFNPVSLNFSWLSFKME